eukprot:TRINITY_DN1067_c0_g1_i4.p1 TRINITY_DN1067_c0_g1~~TRINITY_DN1067_c0_g1_i4.p1  ORF type:complete len:369 (+),score=95.26 TRINITY_DN1067_c0_g1_i4:128-1234(+)
MGCVQSVPPEQAGNENANEGEGKGEGADTPDLARVRNQRRRLSVTPQHVGSIDPNKNDGSKDKDDVAEASNEMKAEMFYATAARSKKGYVPYNTQKKNQDAFIVRERLKNDPNLSLYGVFDGHGEFGELISQFCKDKLPEFLEAEPNLATDPINAITRGTANLCQALLQTKINRQFSGTTAVYGLRIGRKLYTANIGDSRAILVRKGHNGQVEVVALSNDHKPESPEEKARILKHGGRVQPLPGLPDEDCGPPRVWLRDFDVPGLAMSRSIGDEVSHTVGVIDIPEIIEYELGPNDLFAIWASDGIWEFLSNEQVARIVHSHAPNWESAINVLIEAANKRWRSEEEVVDDITCVLVGYNENYRKPSQS